MNIGRDKYVTVVFPPSVKRAAGCTVRCRWTWLCGEAAFPLCAVIGTVRPFATGGKGPTASAMKIETETTRFFLIVWQAR